MHRKHAIFDQKGSEVNGGKRLRDNPFELAVRNVKTTTTTDTDCTEEYESSHYSADSTVPLTESQSTESSYESAEESRMGAGHSDRDCSVVTTHVDTEMASIEVKIRRKTAGERGESEAHNEENIRDSHPVKYNPPPQKNTDGKITKDQPPPPPINKSNVVIRKSREVTRIEGRSHGMPMVKPIVAKQAELMNKQHPFLYPHFMRRTNVFNGQVKNVGMPRDHTSGTVFVELKAQCKWARLSVVPSLSADLHLARLCSSHLKERGRVLLINSQPHRTVVAFVAPPLEETNARLITVEEEGVYRGTVRNMPAPSETLQAKSLTPLWHTVHYTIALGKHVAVPFKIPGPKEIKIKYIRTKCGFATMTAAKSKYAETPKETVYRMTAAPKHTIRLSTVEDPNVHRVERVVVDAEGILHKKEHPQEVDETLVVKKTTRDYAVRREHREVGNTREHSYTKDFYAERDGEERRETRQIAEGRTTRDYRSQDDQRLPRDFYPEREEKERGGDVNGERRDGRQPTVDVIARDKRREMQTNGESAGRHGKPAKITVDVDYDERSSADRRRDPKHHRRKHHHESKAHPKHKERDQKRREPRETRDEVGESSGGSVQVRVRQNGQLHETSFPPLLDSREKRERGESREKRAPSRENEGKKETTSEERRQRREQKNKEREERHRRRDERHREKARLREAEKKREERDGANLQLIGEEGEKKKKPNSVELIGRPKSDSGPGQSDKRDAIGKVPNSKEKTTTTATTGSGESKTPQRSKETVKKEGDNSNNFGSEKNDEVANTEKKKGIARSEGSELAAPKKKDSTLATKEINPVVERRRKSAKLPPPLPAVPPLQQVLSGKSSAEMTKPEEQTGRMVTKASNIPERKPRRKYSAPPPYAPAPVPAQHQSAQLTVPSKTGEKHALLRTKVSKGKYKKSKENGGGSKEHGKGGAPAPAGMLGSKNTQTTKKKSKKTEETKKKAKKQQKEKKEKEKKKKK